MSDRPDDFELLRQYAAEESDEAFARVVGRHADFVYAVALRRTGDAHLAEDVTQATFIVLARRAGTLTSGSLRAWLHQTACYSAANALREKSRRRRVEREAQIEAVSEISSPGAGHALEIRELIDDAVTKLGRGERDVIALHYFEEQTIEQTAGRLGISPEATRKRVTRALEKLRAILQRRGVAMPASGIGAALILLAAHVPIATSLAPSFALGQAGAGSNAFGVAQHVLRQIRRAALRKAALVGGTLLVGTALAAGVVQHWMATRPLNPYASLATTRPASPGGSLSVKLDEKMTLELLDVREKDKPDVRWGLDGTPLTKTQGTGAVLNWSTSYFVHAHVKFDPSDPPGLAATRVPRMSTWGGAMSDSGGGDTGGWIDAIPQFGVANLEIGFARGPWRAVRSFDRRGEVHTLDWKFDGAALASISTLDGFVFVSTSDGDLKEQARIVAFDKAGKTYLPSPGLDGSSSSQTAAFRITSGMFKGLTMEQFDRVEFYVRPYHYVRFDDISLRPGTITPARVSMGRLDDEPLPLRRMYGTVNWNDSLWSVCQFIAFDSQAEVDVRWDKLAKVGLNRGTAIRAALQDPTYQECFDRIIAQVGAARMKMIYVEDRDLKVRKFVVSTPEDLAVSAP